MGLFSKKDDCPICGNAVKGLFNAKIKDKIVLCQDCSRKIKMDTTMLPFQSVDDIKAHLAYREENRQKFASFSVSREQKVNGNLLRIDDDQKLWYFAPKNATNPPLFRFDEVIDYELTEDGETITKGGLGSAVAGGVLFGGVGAIVGATTGAKKTKALVKSINLRITLNNKYIKLVNIELIPMSTNCKAGSLTYKAYKITADHLISMLDSMIRQAQDANRPVSAPTQLSGADEILKYKQLLDSGIITQEEFDAKKKQILGI